MTSMNTRMINPQARFGGVILALIFCLSNTGASERYERQPFKLQR
jgi:hypothetical protein